MRIILISALVLAACSTGPDAATAGRLRVVASFYPLAEVARRVGGADVEVRDLTPAGVEPHDLELTTGRVENLLDADVVLLMGRHFQPSLEDAVDQASGRVVEILPVLHVEGDDPHVWLDPRKMAAIVGVVGDAFVKEDGRHAAGYRARAAAYRVELDALDRRYASTLEPCRRRTLVTAHAAFGWLARRYGLRQEAVTGISPEAEPDPRRLAELTDDVRRLKVTTVFTETLVSTRVARALAREAGVRTAVLNPVEGLTTTERRAGKSYVSIMDDNLRTLAGALAC